MTKKKRKMSKAQQNVIVDVGLLGLFMTALAQEATGLALHEWLGLSFVGAATGHLLLHSKWVAQSAKRFFGKMPWKTRANYILAAALLANVGLVAYSGVQISEVAVPNVITTNANLGLWQDLHEGAAGAFSGLVGAHLLLHWKWILGMSKKYLAKPFNNLRLPKIDQPQPALAKRRIEQ